MSFVKRVNIMSEEIELIRKNLEKLISDSESLIDNEVVRLSQELDKHISKYYLDEDKGNDYLDSLL